MLLALVFGAIFLLVLSALSGYLLAQNGVEDATRVRAEALAVAEGGLDYYKWHLAHFPTDLENGTGAPGPYDITVPNPEGGTAGTAALTITANTACGQTQSIDISSKGLASDGANSPVTIVARYAEPSVASYSYIVNASVWAGSDRTINGPYHSNGGIRMDGTANAPVTSSLSTWDCTSDFGCSPEQRTASGVVGSGTNQNLWNYPTPQVDFAGIAADFSTLKTVAKSSGLYFARYSSGNSNSAAYHKGYHLIFNSNGTVTVNKVALENYFQTPQLQYIVRQPLTTIGLEKDMDVKAKVHGGGIHAQAESLRHAIARAVIQLDPETRRTVKKQGFLMRDPRVKERKKPGLKRARRAPQFSKR